MTIYCQVPIPTGARQLMVAVLMDCGTAMVELIQPDGVRTDSIATTKTITIGQTAQNRTRRISSYLPLQVLQRKEIA